MMYDVSQHAMDQFCFRYLGQSHRLHQDEYYKRLITMYVENAVPIKMPLHAEIEKLLKYDDSSGKKERYLLNRQERILFVLVGDCVVTCYYPYDDSKRFTKHRVRGMFPHRRKRSN